MQLHHCGTIDWYLPSKSREPVSLPQPLLLRSLQRVVLQSDGATTCQHSRDCFTDVSSFVLQLYSKYREMQGLLFNPGDTCKELLLDSLETFIS